LTPVLIDTSAWIEYLRRTGSEPNLRVRSLIEGEQRIATTDVVIMELLMGARRQEARAKIWALLNRCVMLPVRPLLEYEQAAALYLRCRAAGFTPSNTSDLLVASVAIGKDVPLLAADADFLRIASVAPLQLA